MKSILAAESEWRVFVAVAADVVTGFVSIQCNEQTKAGEIGLNAVDPLYAGKGIGTELYKFGIGIIKEAGMKVATVSTGGDPSHAPARRAYRKAGFTVGIPSV